MARKLTVLAAVPLFVLSACGADLSVPLPSVSRMTIPADKAACTNGIIISISEGTVLDLGTDLEGPHYTVSGIRIENGIRKAYVGGGGKEIGSIGQTLQVGESVTHPGVGTFTLRSITPYQGDPELIGAGGSAGFCFEPEPGFEVDPCLVKEQPYWHTLPPSIPSPAADEPNCPDDPYEADAADETDDSNAPDETDTPATRQRNRIPRTRSHRQSHGQTSTSTTPGREHAMQLRATQRTQLGTAIITAALLGSTLTACGADLNVPMPSVSRMTIPADKAACTNGIPIGIREGTRSRLGVPPDGVNYTVYGVRIENGVRKATLSGGNTITGIDRTLQVGESVTQPGVGTFTLLSITPEERDRDPELIGSGGSAGFCFEPEPGFEIDPCLVKQMFADQPLPPTIPSPAADEPRCPDDPDETNDLPETDGSNAPDETDTPTTPAEEPNPTNA